jgi:hypothetical protein
VEEKVVGSAAQLEGEEERELGFVGGYAALL